jgi:hypothetical protein
MKKAEYTFKAHYHDVGFGRIVDENSGSDFIRVEWRVAGDGEREIVLVTTKGFDRLVRAGLRDHVGQGHLRIDSEGCILHLFNFESRVSYVLGDFHQLYVELRERENRRRTIKVTSIV